MNSVLRRIFGVMRDGAKGEWRKLRKKLNDQYCPPNIVQVRKIDKNEIGRACSV